MRRGAKIDFLELQSGHLSRMSLEVVDWLAVRLTCSGDRAAMARIEALLLGGRRGGADLNTASAR